VANRYTNITRRVNEDGVRYITNPIYPDIPETPDDIYLITTGADRYDTLAQIYYGDYRYWWIIATANSVQKRDGLIVKPGVQLRIPANKDEVVDAFENLNSSR